VEYRPRTEAERKLIETRATLDEYVRDIEAANTRLAALEAENKELRESTAFWRASTEQYQRIEASRKRLAEIEEKRGES